MDTDLKDKTNTSKNSPKLKTDSDSSSLEPQEQIIQGQQGRRTPGNRRSLRRRNELNQQPTRSTRLKASQSVNQRENVLRACVEEVDVKFYGGDATNNTKVKNSKANEENISNNCEQEDSNAMECSVSDKDNVKHSESNKSKETVALKKSVASEVSSKDTISSLSHKASEGTDIKNSPSPTSLQEVSSVKMEPDSKLVEKGSQKVSMGDSVSEEDMDVDSVDEKKSSLLSGNKEVKCKTVDEHESLDKLKVGEKVKATESSLSNLNESKDACSPKCSVKIEKDEAMEIDGTSSKETSQVNSKAENRTSEVGVDKDNAVDKVVIACSPENELISSVKSSKDKAEEQDSSKKTSTEKQLNTKSTAPETASIDDIKDISKVNESSPKDGASDNVSNQKEKGKGIDAIAEKLGLQAKGTSNLENNTSETSNGVKETSIGKQKSASEKISSPAAKTNGAADKADIKVSEKANETPISSEQKTVTPKSETQKSKKSSRTCAECSVTKGLKFQVLFQGKTRYLCSDTCFKSFRAKQKLTPTGSGSSTAPAVKAESKDLCSQCKKELKDGQGFFPPAGESKPLCSEDCLKKYHQVNGCKKTCAQCKNTFDSGKVSLTWETMEYCNEDCLGKYQAFLGSHCTCCQTPVQQASLGKYCVRFGTDIRQFCTGRCLEEFKKGLKVCSFCQKDLSAGIEGFLAPVGDKGQFKDFCTQQCMERYETMNSSSSSSPETQQCSHCKKTSVAKLQVQHEEKTHFMCSDTCIAGFRYSNKITSNICYTCYKLFDIDPKEPFVLQYEASNKHFCAKACMTLFVLSHRKIVPCTSCKVKKYNFDMIEKVDSNNQVNLFCSLNCLSVYRVGAVATPAKSIRCDHCAKNVSAMYHLTMSDGSIRNFCSYNCVITFQNQFTNVPTLTTTTSSARQSMNSQTTGTKTVNASSTPVISSVMSLAPTPSPRTATSPAFSTKTTAQKAPPVRQLPPPLVVTTTKSQTSTATTTTSTSSTSTSGASAGSQIIREVIVKPAAPKSMKNKTILCKPIMQSKGVTCKPQPCHKAVQTDDGGGRPIIVPIPVPIYVPTPVVIYSRPVPCPVPFPVPIPVPIFVPTTKDSPTQIIKQLKDIQEKIPANPFEAELLTMAEMAAENIGRKEVMQNNSEVLENSKLHTDEPIPPPPPPPPPPPASKQEPPEIPLDLEAALPPSVTPILKKEQENVSDQDEEYIPKEIRSRTRSAKRSVAVRGRGRGRKRTKLDEFSTEDSDSLAAAPVMEDQSPPLQPVAPDAHLCLKVDV